MFKDYIEVSLGFMLSIVDPYFHYQNNIWLDRSQYYELLLVYVDDVLAIIHEPKSIM